MPRQIFEIVDLWFCCRRVGGVDGKALPASGGVGDQPAALMDAFMMLDDFAKDKVE